MGLGTLPEDAKQHANPSRYEERLERPLADLAFYRPVQILKALAPLLIDLGPCCLHCFLGLGSHVLHSLLDLSPYLLRSLFNIGSHILYSLPDLGPRRLYRLLDLSPYILYLHAQCLGLVMALSVRHGRVRFLHLMYACHLSSFSYGPCFTSSRGIALKDLVSTTRECKLNAIARVRSPLGYRRLDSGTYFAAKRLEASQGLCDFA